MTEPQVREAGRLVLVGAGRPLVTLWVARWIVHEFLGVDRGLWKDHWATLTRALVDALYYWANGNVAEAGSRLRRGVAIYDIWMREAGLPGPGAMRQSLDLGLLFLREWSRLQS